MVDEQELRKVARELSGLYLTMESMKFSRGLIPEARVQKPAPGPQSPGNLAFIDWYAQVERELRPLAVQALKEAGADFIEGDLAPFRLCSRIAWYAQAISELDIADDLMQLLARQLRQTTHWCYPQGVDQVAARAEPRHGAEYIAKRLRAQGHTTITADRVRQWANRGHITTSPLPNGRRGYLMTEVLQHLQV